MDIILDKNGDLALDAEGDLIIDESVKQKIEIKLKWFLGEWRWSPESGIDYFENFFVKNPDLEQLKFEITQQIFEVDEVTDVQDASIKVDKENRSAVIRFTAYTDYEVIESEVNIVE